jgi:hypothetical protein
MGLIICCMTAAYYVYNKKKSKMVFLMAQDLSNQLFILLIMSAVSWSFNSMKLLVKKNSMKLLVFMEIAKACSGTQNCYSSLTFVSYE